MLLEVSGLSKSYKKKKAVDNIDFHIRKGEIFGLLGENGAGKTTTIKMLSTLTIPDSGEAVISGVDIFRNKRRAREIMAVVPQEINLDGELTVFENLLIYAKLRKVKDSKSAVDGVIERFGIKDKRDERVMNLSGGQKRRVMIARVMLTDAELIFMDEPTIGLDPAIRRDIWQIITSVRESGKSILLTTHYTDEAENLCDRVAIMSKGKIVQTDTPEKLIETSGSFAMDIIDGNKFTTKLFKSEKDIEDYAGEQNLTFKVRKSKLEDVVIKAGEAE